MAAATQRRRPRKLNKRDIEAALNGDGARAMHLDLVGTAEAALNILNVERARIGRWRRIGILLADGTRIPFPEPIIMATTSAKQNRCDKCGTFYDYVEPKAGRKLDGCPNCGASAKNATVVADHSKLAATPLWWSDDIRALKKLLDKNKPRN